MSNLNEDFLFLQQSVSSIVANSAKPTRAYLIRKQVTAKEGRDLTRSYLVSIPGVGVFENEMISSLLLTVTECIKNMDKTAENELGRDMGNAMAMADAVGEMLFKHK
jgi:hypothetical protein